jgi:hypothetical protein
MVSVVKATLTGVAEDGLACPVPVSVKLVTVHARGVKATVAAA